MYYVSFFSSFKVNFSNFIISRTLKITHSVQTFHFVSLDLYTESSTHVGSLRDYIPFSVPIIVELFFSSLLDRFLNRIQVFFFIYKKKLKL